MQSRPNVHHTTLLAAELSGSAAVEMGHGRPIISGGKQVALGGQAGIVFHSTPEEDALVRWQRGEFLEVERLIAKAWRRALSNIDFSAFHQRFQQVLTSLGKPKTLHDAKSLADSIVAGQDQEAIFRFGLWLVGVPPNSQNQVIERWKANNRPPICEFSPYFTFVLSVDLFFYLAIAANLISRTKKSNKVDLAYLYYLPFCMVFASNDNFHASVVPLFLRANQSFVKGMDLKADFCRLDQHYSLLPDETKVRGVFHFAAYPPTDNSFLVTQLWDKHLPLWRRQHAEPRKQLAEPLHERARILSQKR